MLYPKEPLLRAIAQSPGLKRKVWAFLNGIRPEEMLSEGTLYGEGRHKLEPKELGRVPAAALAELLPELAWSNQSVKARLFGDVPIHRGFRTEASSMRP